ncbi:DNA alkylation repair protein [Georgenia sp. AZ-5]|uniref:DNA alkylation repair protein n=1 Tax=Georgenia sp. AZ-5 TaxID=3367526 RepID=UPI0037547F22
MGGTPTAERFLERLRGHASPSDAEQLARYFRTGPGGYGWGDRFLGARMGPVNALAREFAAMDLAEIETLLASPFHEARAGALSVMALQAARRRTTEERRRELVDLYLRHPGHSCCDRSLVPGP